MVIYQGYQLRKKISINGQVGAGTNFQVNIWCHKGIGVDYLRNDLMPTEAHVYLANACFDFPNDIRFTGSDLKTGLDQYLVSSNGTDALYIVEVEEDLDADKFIYVCYRKLGASLLSDGDAVFPLFDNFDGATIRADLWTIFKSGECVVSLEDDTLKINAGNGRGGVYSYGKRSVTLPFALEYSMKHQEVIGGGWMVGSVWLDIGAWNGTAYNPAKNAYYEQNYPFGGTDTLQRKLNNVDTQLDTNSPHQSIGVWHKWFIGVGSDFMKIYSDQVLILDVSSYTYDRETGGIGCFASGGAARKPIGWFNNLWVRKYTDPFVTFASIGSVESGIPTPQEVLRIIDTRLIA